MHHRYCDDGPVHIQLVDGYFGQSRHVHERKLAMSTMPVSNCGCGDAFTVAPGFSHSKCETCGDFWFPTSIENSEDAIVPQNRTTPFACPRCEIDLVVGKTGNTEVCFCQTCRGFVVDSESLGHLIAFRRASYKGPDDVPTPANFRDLDVRATCPACFAYLDAHHYFGPGNIVIDTCMQCKLAWLDHGELSKIIRASGKR